MRVVKKLEVTGYLPGIAAVNQPAERGLKDLLSVPLIGGTHKISVQMSAERGKSLSVRAVTQAVAEALRRDDHVTVLRVSGSTEDDPHAEIDLLNARLEESFEIGRRGRRSSRDER